ncbi:uncharacterized protein LOC113360197 [Papaver somniferum]|uniref:uncharacterized protein LOC113360197 n=1 Tax=Papaver somniferum TaxID=3469 RepID=UPI000E6FFCEB|nr:uncharacterized protein LOC113360197 [Papaver somniferum]
MAGLQNYSSPSFFKVMSGDFSKKLKIPVNFIEKFNGVIPYDSVFPSSISSNGAKSVPSRKRKECEETSKGTFTNYGSQFDHYKYHAGDIGRDSSFGSDKRDCGLFKCEAVKKKAIVSKRRTGVHQAECPGIRRKPYFIAIWTENKKYQMEIPGKVVRKIGRTLSDIVALKSADGILWNVELKRSEGKVWFYKGWKEFTEHESLRDGHVLGISYIGNSQFSVCITNVMDHLGDSRNQGESNPKKRPCLSKRVADDDDMILLDSPAPISNSC